MRLNPGDLVRSYYRNIFAYPTVDDFFLGSVDKHEVSTSGTLLVIACQVVSREQYKDIELMFVLIENTIGWVSPLHFGNVDWDKP